ncbi:MAG TPA: spermidine synthase, partial [Rubrivivax sp.]|nr:spermidine synthase [Rubrivivax sp.]
MLASGFAGLGYQMVWTQQFSLWLGHDNAAVLAVVAAFFGGLAAGALWLGPRIERSLRPQRWYAGCEVLIGSWSLLLAALMAPAGSWLLQLTGAQPSPAWQWTVAFCGSFLLLLPATAAMGATLPALRRMLAPADASGAWTARLYAANTAGAMGGVLAAAFWLVPGWGLLRTAAVCAALNIVCALLSWSFFRSHVPPQPASKGTPLPRRLAVQLASTGLLGIGYEVLVVRVLSQVAENTVYTFAMLLAVYLLGTALGAAAWQRRTSAPDGPDDAAVDRLLCLLSAACLLGILSLWGAAAVKAGVLNMLGASLAAALAAEAVLALLAFLPPTLLMGALFSCLAARAAQRGLGLGRALGINTLGAAGAPLLFGVGLVPIVGAKPALLGLAAAYLLLLSRPVWTLRGRPAWAAAGLTGALLVAAALAPPLRFVDVPPGGRIVSFEEGAMAAVSVVEDAEGVARLHINNRQQEGSSASFDADARQALLPLLLHPAPRRALFLGLGTGVTASAAAADRLLRVDAVELLPEVVAASAHFRSSATPLPRLLTADARRFVRASDERYDVIVSDNFHPARSGSGALYTVEHFLGVRGRLRAEGLFCQWLPLHQLDLASLRSIVAAFVAAYPNGFALLATHSLQTPVLGLVGRADDGRFDMPALQARMASADPALGHAELGLGNPMAVLGSFIAGPTALARFAAGAPVNSDDHPVVSYAAPRVTYAPDSLPRDRLLALLRELSISA